MGYFVVLLVNVGFGFIDAGVKAFWNWNDLPEFFQGWSWHIFLFTVYTMFLFFISKIRRFSIWSILGSLFLWIDEDVTYYFIKSIGTKHFYWNSWLFSSLLEYLLIVVVLNVFAYILLKNSN